MDAPATTKQGTRGSVEISGARTIPTNAKSTTARIAAYAETLMFERKRAEKAKQDS
jgi:hypothetical protein